MKKRSHTQCLLLALATAAATLTGSCGEGQDLEPIENVARAQDNPPPPGCGSWDQVPADFQNRCVLWGGERIECSGGQAWCCKTATDRDGDEYEHCTSAPRKPPRDRAPLFPLPPDRLAPG